MGEIVSNSINYVKEVFPEVAIKQGEEYIEFRGRFVIQVVYNDEKLDIAPKLKILFPRKYPNFLPLTYELEQKIESNHKLSDGALCVATRFDQLTQLSTSCSIKDYIERFLIPYFISYYNWKKTGKYVYGDRSHGVQGIYQSIAEYFHIDSSNREFISSLLTWAAKNKKFKFIFFSNRYNIKGKFGKKIGELRKSGIYNLRIVDRELKYLKEFEKRYFDYINNKEKPQ